MAQNTYDTGKSLRFEFWLVFDDDGTMRLTRREPDVSRGERSMFCSALLPKSLWRVPTLRAAVTIPEGDAPSAFRIDVQAASDALSSALGVDIDLQIHHHPPEN